MSKPYKEGATFIGWTGTDLTEPTLNVTITGGSCGDRSYKANWSSTSQVVSFDSLGGSSVKHQTVVTNNQVVEPKDPSRDGYRFDGWYTDAKGTEKYDFRKPVNSSFTLYARWSPLNYRINYKLDHGSNASANPKAYTMIDDTIRLGAPVRAGYSFVGWYKDSGFKTKVTTIKKGSRGDLTLYAKWKNKAKGPFFAKSVSIGKTANRITWAKAAGAQGYDVFFAKCNTSRPKKTYKLKMVKSLGGTSWTKTKLKNGISYKYQVRAWKKVNGKKTYIAVSPAMHSIAGNYNKSFANAKSIGVSKSAVTLKKGKTLTLKCTVKATTAKKKLLVRTHYPAVRYYTSNKDIAAVSGTGKITAKAVGTCTIYTVATNGIRKAVSVTVK